MNDAEHLYPSVGFGQRRHIAAAGQDLTGFSARALCGRNLWTEQHARQIWRGHDIDQFAPCARCTAKAERLEPPTPESLLL